MWIKCIYVLVLIKLSHQECQRFTTTSHFDTGYSYRLISKSHISCSDLRPSSDLREDILPEMSSSVLDVTISNSSIPELIEGTFNDIELKNLTIAANVEIIQNKAFEHCKISSITLDFNDIKKIKDRSFNSTAIKSLSLQHNGLSEIGAGNLVGLTNLKQLNLNHNKISVIREGSFGYLTNLEELELSHNNLVELHFELFRNLTHLDTIYLNNNDLRNFTKGLFSSCISLKELHIENNFITTLSDVGYLPNSLLKINASNNKLTFVSFSTLDKIKSIDINFNNLSVNGMFHNLFSVSYLYCNYNSLGPNYTIIAFNSLNGLTELQLIGNELKNFDFRLLKNLTHLKYLSLAVNYLTRLDFSESAANLTRLDLSCNSLKEIENLSRLQQLVQLNLSSNSLEEIKYDTFEKLGHLKKLYLQFNSIHTMHIGCLKDLNSLLYLDLSHNEITHIDLGAFAGVNSLVTLNLSYNSLFHLDENTFHNFDGLMNLNLAYNNLQSIKLSRVLIRMNLEYGELNLIGNNWTCKSLGDLIVSAYRINLTPGTAYNVSNMFGIACSNYNVKNHSLGDMNMELIKSIEKQEKDISYKITLTNAFTILLLVLIFVKFSSNKFLYCYKTAEGIIRKRRGNEQEMQLIR